MNLHSYARDGIISHETEGRLQGMREKWKTTYNEREKDAASSTRKETVPEVQVMQFCSIYEQQWQACSRRMGRSGEDHEGNGGSKGDAPCKPTWSKERESQNSYC